MDRGARPGAAGQVRPARAA